MKISSVKFLVVLILVGVLSSCTNPIEQTESKNDLLYDDVRVSYVVAQDEWPAKYKKEDAAWQNCIPFLLPQSDIDLKAFLKKYISNSLEKNVDVYDESIVNEPYRHLDEKALYSLKNKWESFTSGSDSELDTVDYESNMKFINFDRYVSLLFFEEWYFDVENLDFEKIVEGISPVFRFKKEEQLYRGRSGLIVPAIGMDKEAVKASDMRLERVGKLVYEYRLNPAACEGKQSDLNNEVVNDYAPMLNRHVYQPILERLLYSAIKGELPVYDFYDRSKRLSKDEVAEKCNYKKQDVPVLDNNGNEAYRTIEPYLDIYEYNSLVFEEDLYVDWETLRLTKKVLSITPVRSYVHETGELRKKLTFTIKLGGN